MSDKPKVFKKVSYDNGGDAALVVSPWNCEATIAYGESWIDICYSKECLEDYRDMFKAALDDMEKDNG